MPQTLAAVLPYIPPSLARALLAVPTLAPLVEQLPAAVLFADISGFTPLTEALAQRGAEGPEEMTRLLNAYFSRLIVAIEAEGGEVVKFSGDALTALFPATAEPAGHAARRAVQAAAAMHALMDDFATLPTSAGPIALAVKVGVGVGTVYAFRVGGVLERWEYVVAGDPLRQVAEAEYIAGPGETIISPETAAVLASPTTPSALPSRPLTAPQFAPNMNLRMATAALRGFIPGALRAWIGEGLPEWWAELRPMSLLFVGVSGLDYTAPDALERLQALLTASQEVIYRYEGSLNKLAVDDKGTILLAMFGAPPLAHADDAARAAQAARDLLVMAEAQGLAMAIGVATGPVFAGPVGSTNRREYTVMGDAVNSAARLMAAAGPGDIRCDFATAHDARRVLAFDTLPPVRLKGKVGLAQVYRPTGLARSQEQAGTTMVGRQAELARLEAALDDVQADCQRLLLIEGEAGMGKSRLLEELTGLCHARGLTVLAGAGHSSERQIPYRAWREVFNAYFELGKIEAPDERRRLVHAQVAEIAPELVERLPLLNDLLSTGFPETPLTAALESERRYQGREALLIELLRRWAAERPLVLNLEDVHWMDTRSWGLVLAVASALHTAGLPLLMVLTMRPIPRLDRPPDLVALEALSGTEHIRLTALSPTETVALAASSLGVPAHALPPAVAELVRSRADGNPFFAEEIALALRDQGVLAITQGDGQCYCVLHGELDEAARHLPDTIQGIVLSRIDRLDPEEQMLLRVGAVIGRSFPYQPLQAALSPYLVLADTDLRARLERLAVLDLLPQETPAPNLRHAFKNAITHEVAYGTMLFAQRRELHRRVAEWYEAHYDLDDAGANTGEAPVALTLQQTEIVHLLAYHYQQAGDTACERRYAALAGELAAAGFANAEALVYLNRALVLTPPEARTARHRLLLIREQVYDVLADRLAQEADIAALSDLSAADDMRAQAELALRQANYRLVTDKFPRAAEAAERAAELAHSVGWYEGETMARRIHGAALIPLAHYDEARTQLGQALDRARSMGLAGTEDDCLRDLGLIAYYQGDYATARGYYEQALAIDQAIGDRRGQSATLVRLGAVLRELGDSTMALTCYEQALVIDRATGDRDDEADGLRGIGMVAYDRGDYLAARAAYTESLTLERATGDREGQAACLAALGRVARVLGDLAAAQEALDQALVIHQEVGDRRYEAAVRADLALLCSQRGDHQAAREQAQTALELAGALGARYVEATAFTRLGQALHGLADLQEAESAYQAALRLCRELGVETLVLEPLAGLARLALANGDLATARTRANELATTLEAEVIAWTDELPQLSLSCYQVLSAAGDARAAQVLEVACARLNRQASQISDATCRQAFWEDVPTHRALLAAYVAQEGRC
jgi:class 3 adenylate cyclase/tetratricopeptide (TPR) repeat protein